MKKFLENEEANIKMIGTVVAIFVTLIISVLVLYNIVGSIDYTTVDDNLAAQLTDDGVNNEAYAENASNALLSQSETFYTIAPIIGIVIVAVIILGYVTRIGGA